MSLLRLLAIPDCKVPSYLDNIIKIIQIVTFTEVMVNPLSGNKPDLVEWRVILNMADGGNC